MSADEHSRFAPSSMARRLACLGSYTMEQNYPQRTESPAAMEGTAWHEVCAQMVRGEPVSAVGSLASNGIAITDEMIEAAELCVEAIPLEWLKSCHVEERVDISIIHDDCWGTPDAWYYDHTKRTLRLYDWKFGHGFVDEFENAQLTAYAAGIIDEHGYDDQQTYVSFTIGQPRCFTGHGAIRTWGCKASDLRGAVNNMKRVCGLIDLGQAQCRVGAHCLNCSGVHACPAAQQAAQQAFDFVSSPVPSEMTPSEKGIFLARVEQSAAMLKAMQRGLTEEVEDSIRRGIAVPGWGMVPGQGKTEWSAPFADIATLGDVLGVNVRKEALLTPIQAAAKLKKAGVDGSVILGYSTVTPGALKLAKTDTDAMRRVFGSNNHKE